MLYQFVKMFEDFWFSLLGIFKLNRKDRTFSQSKFANACKMAFLAWHTYWLIFLSLFIDLHLTKITTTKLSAKFFSDRNVKNKDDRHNRYTNIIKAWPFHSYIGFQVFYKRTNLVRAVLLIAMSLPIIITYRQVPTACIQWDGCPKWTKDF